jgi:hypothetical protein
MPGSCFVDQKLRCGAVRFAPLWFAIPFEIAPLSFFKPMLPKPSTPGDPRGSIYRILTHLPRPHITVPRLAVSHFRALLLSVRTEKIGFVW